MTDNPYAPPSPAVSDRNEGRYSIAKSAGPIFVVGCMIAGGMVPVYLPIYFGESIRSYTQELPVMFRLLLFVLVIGLMIGGIQLGHRFSTKVWR